MSADADEEWDNQSEVMVKLIGFVRLGLVLLLAFALGGVALGGLSSAVARRQTGWQGELPGDTVFLPADNPHIIEDDVIVPTGVTLTLAPSAELHFAPGASLLVYGRLNAVGTSSQPITLTWRDEGQTWGAVAILDSLADNRLEHVIVEHAGEEPDTTPRHQGVTVRNARLTIAHSVIRHVDGRGAHVEDNSIFSLLDSEIYQTRGDGVSVAGGQIVIQRNHIHDIAWEDHNYEGISINEISPDHPALVTDNHIHHISDDCFDVNRASATLARNRVHHCGDKAVSVGALLGQYPNDSVIHLANNLIYASASGVVIKDSATSHLVNNTIVDHQGAGIVLYEAHVDQGGGRAFVTNTIVWGNATPVSLDAHSMLSVTFSDVTGGWPGLGNLDVVPEFWAESEYRLSETSLCRDAGTLVGMPSTDLDGHARPVGPAPDLGAYEWPPLRLAVQPRDAALALRWHTTFTPSTAATYAITSSSASTGIFPSYWITGLLTNTLTYSMSPLVNGTCYTVTVELWDSAGHVLLRSNAVSAVPARFAVYLPLVTRQPPPEPDMPVTYHITLAPEDLVWLDEHIGSRETVPARFIDQGFVYDVGVRYRGEVARWLPKKSWKVDFDSAQLFQGQREINLNAEYPDKSLLREWLAYDLFERAGLIAPRANFAQLYINEEYRGLFTEVDQVDQRFLHRFGLDPNGNLYKGDYGAFHLACTPEIYAEQYVKRTNKEDSYADLIAFIEMLNLTPAPDLPVALAEVMDVGAYLDWYALQILIGNFEWVEKNFYLYHDLVADRWLMIPWDMDLSFGLNHTGTVFDDEISWQNPIDGGTENGPKPDGAWNQLTTVILEDDAFRYAYCRRLRELLDDEFAEEVMFARIDAAYALIESSAEADPYKWGTNDEFNARPDELKTYIARRRAWLLEQMPDYCPSGAPLPVFNEVMSVNATTLADEAGEFDPWLEVYNPGSTFIDLGGMQVVDEAGRSWAFPGDVSLPPEGFLVLWADAQREQGAHHATIQLNTKGGQLTLLDKAVHGAGEVARLDYGPLSVDLSFGPRHDGATDYVTFLPATPGWSNQGQSPGIGTVTQNPVEPDVGREVTLTAVITDADNNLRDVWLTYAVMTQTTPLTQALTLQRAERGLYSATLPACEAGAVVTYTLHANDDAGMQAETTRRYRVGFHRPSLYLNEFVAINEDGLKDEVGETNDWFEIYNAGPSDVDLGGMYLTDTVERSTQWQIPAGVRAPAGGYVIFWADEDLGQGVTHVGFKLDGDSGRLALYAGSPGYHELIDEVYYGPQMADQALGRYPDGVGAWRVLPPTPGAPNRQPPPVIHEVMRDPPAPDAGERVTLTAHITNDDAPITATLVYNTGTLWLSSPMTPTAAETYVASIPPHPDGAWVTYYVTAYDSASGAGCAPGAAPLVVYGYRVGQPNTLVINELMADNERTIADDAGVYEDWLELYNSGTITETLGGLYLSDDLSRPDKWQIPVTMTLAPGGLLLIWADDDARDGPLHATFKLNRQGEELGLFKPHGASYILVDRIRFGPQAADVSYGRFPDGGERWRVFIVPTPGRANGAMD